VTEAARLIRYARYLTTFTGAGISVESGIPPFRGAGGLWDRYDPRTLEIEFFLRHPEQAWPVIREIFYDNFGKAKPNRAHEVLAAWEKDGWPRGGGSTDRGLLKCLITQNKIVADRVGVPVLVDDPAEGGQILLGRAAVSQAIPVCPKLVGEVLEVADGGVVRADERLDEGVHRQDEEPLIRSSQSNQAFQRLLEALLHGASRGPGAGAWVGRL
jgi:hypothetical protein